ncbi:MAG: hypothetical protein H8E42_06570 [Nitrospinae bacterium]|nr:hypothetical protein [Nitrospinota bacterium]MBL7019674.1 hypothetical protein [Nitrospinaceae bacterium]
MAERNLANELQKHIAEQAKKEHEEAEKKRWDKYLEVCSSTYDKASAYNKLVVGVGYLGFFIFWRNLHTDLALWEKVGSATLLLISAVIYIITEVFTMQQRNSDQAGLNEIFNCPVAEFQQKSDEYHKAINEREVKYRPVWIRVQNITLYFGVAGGAVMLYGFVRILATIA